MFNSHDKAAAATDAPRSGRAMKWPGPPPGGDLAAALRRIDEKGDTITADHTRRMGQYAVLLAEQFGLGPHRREQIYYASLLHDIGKLAMPAWILRKPGRLNRDERAIMNTHTHRGAMILRGYNFRHMDIAVEVALSHHEHWDGSGYPRGLSGEAIPLPARIVAICDVYDALRSRRPYKDPYRHGVALDKIRHGDGWVLPEHFDPQVLATFLDINQQFDQIYSRSLNTSSEAEALCA